MGMVCFDLVKVSSCESKDLAQRQLEGQRMRLERRVSPLETVVKTSAARAIAIQSVGERLASPVGATVSRFINTN